MKKAGGHATHARKLVVDVATAARPDPSDAWKSDKPGAWKLSQKMADGGDVHGLIIDMLSLSFPLSAA